MAKCKELRLKHSELEYLFELAISNEADGTYWGRRDYFYRLQTSVIHKLGIALNTPASKSPTQEPPKEEYK